MYISHCRPHDLFTKKKGKEHARQLEFPYNDQPCHLSIILCCPSSNTLSKPEKKNTKKKMRPVVRENRKSPMSKSSLSISILIQNSECQSIFGDLLTSPLLCSFNRIFSIHALKGLWKQAASETEAPWDELIDGCGHAGGNINAGLWFLPPQGDTGLSLLWPGACSDSSAAWRDS